MDRFAAGDDLRRLAPLAARPDVGPDLGSRTRTSRDVEVGKNTRLSISAYSRELPGGVVLVRCASAREFVVVRASDGEVLATREEATVLAWRRPARVFASIARRGLGTKGRP